MAYEFDFAPVLAQADLLLKGAWFTLQLTAIGTLLGVAIGVLGAGVRAWHVRPFDVLFGLYVELIRNTPSSSSCSSSFRPACARHSPERMAGGGAGHGGQPGRLFHGDHPRRYPGHPQGQLEAAAALAMNRFEAFRHVVLQPALAKVWPALTSQIVIVMLGSAVCSQIATEELSFAANFIQSRNFRAFETYLLTTALYLLMAILLRQSLAWLGQRLLMGRR